MNRAAAWALVVVGLVWFVGCGGLASKLNPMSPAERTYWEVASRYLVRAGVYQGPATRLIIKALPLNWAVRRAQLRREAAAYGWSKTRLSAALNQAKADSAKWEEVAIAVFTPNPKANDLDQPNPSWRVYLKAGDKLMAPVDIRALRKRTPRALMLYPFWDPWSRLYILRFKALGQPKAKLVITGPGGRAELGLVLRAGH